MLILGKFSLPFPLFYRVSTHEHPPCEGGLLFVTTSAYNYGAIIISTCGYKNQAVVLALETVNTNKNT